MTTRGELRTVSQFISYITAGRAVVTLQSLKTGDHITVKFCRRRGEPQVFSLMQKEETGVEYKGAFVMPHYSLRMTQGTKLHRALSYLFLFIRRKGHLPEQMKIFHEGTCGVCGRALTNPESIATGIGPHCAGKR